MRIRRKTVWRGLWAGLALLLLLPAQSWAQWQAPGRDQVLALANDLLAYAETARREWNVPGLSVAVVYDGEVLLAEGLGTTAHGGSTEVDADTVFQIGSTTKAFTATLAAMEVDAGRLGWDDLVTEHLSDFSMYDPATTAEMQVTDLMAQNSGLPFYAGDSELFLGFSSDYYLDSLDQLPPAYAFRRRYTYQNSMFLAAGKVSETTSGLSYEDMLSERIFEPLGMDSASASLEGFLAEENRADLHKTLGGRVTVLSDEWAYQDVIYNYGGAAAINASINDMTDWLVFLQNQGEVNGQRLVSQENLDYTQAPRTDMGGGLFGSEASYCQGWIYEPVEPSPLVWHNGGSLGMKAMVATVPGTGLGVAVLSNLDKAMLPEALAMEFLDAYFGNDDVDWPAKYLVQRQTELAQSLDVSRPDDAVDPAFPTLYTGEYYNSVLGTVTVSLENNRLVLNAGPKNIDMPLSAYDGDSFLLTWPDIFGITGLARFQRAGGMTGGITGLVVDAFNTDGEGVFVKLD